MLGHAISNKIVRYSLAKFFAAMCGTTPGFELFKIALLPWNADLVYRHYLKLPSNNLFTSLYCPL